MPSTVKERSPLLRTDSRVNHWNHLTKKSMILRAAIALMIMMLMVGGVWILQWFVHEDTSPNFNSLKDHCSHIQPIQPEEFIARHQKLADTLRKEEAEALIVEAGSPSLKYYVNIEWNPSERPFMAVFQTDTSNKATGIRTTIVTPAFESSKAERALKMANLPDGIQPSMVKWLEHESPFTGLLKMFNNDQSDLIYVDSQARVSIYQGIKDALSGRLIKVAPVSVRRLRMIKSEAELKILKCVNSVTEMAIRAVRPHVKSGMTELDIQDLMQKALRIAGLTDIWTIALVDENAALPHGTSTSKRVTEKSTILIDTGGLLHGYQSDITRTWFLADQGKHNKTIEEAWYLVRQAQQAVLNKTWLDVPCAEVDLTAREVIEDGGFGPYFLHRLGHGIGMEMHEEPFLNKGNFQQRLKTGITFTVEPGIYVQNQFGIRLEDVVVVTENGTLELLTDGLADNPWTLA